jgi:hypothetical protein
MDRVSPALYEDVKAYLLENDGNGPPMYQWATHELKRPDTAESLAAEIIWIILCAGRLAQAARTIERKVWAAINEERPVVEAFGYKKKADAIEYAWWERQKHFGDLNALSPDDIDGLLAWCDALPYVGKITRYQLMKNLGINVCKPDIWLCRLAGIPDSPQQPITVRFDTCQACVRHYHKKLETGFRWSIVCYGWPVTKGYCQLVLMPARLRPASRFSH